MTLRDCLRVLSQYTHCFTSPTASKLPVQFGLTGLSRWNGIVENSFLPSKVGAFPTQTWATILLMSHWSMPSNSFTILTFRSKFPEHWQKKLSLPPHVSLHIVSNSPLTNWCCIDPKSVLLPPNKISGVPAPFLNKIVISLATRYGITVATAQKYIPAQLSQWGKVCRSEGGDTMHACDLIRLSDGDRNMSYVHVSKFFWYYHLFTLNPYVVFHLQYM